MGRVCGLTTNSIYILFFCIGSRSKEPGHQGCGTEQQPKKLHFFKK